ncbi:hypothetical protein IW140_004829 [Coemansia sp. RSA 1813]|nr:hypothetical protein EV178_004874 [Coemansia sp. RSA 1646]KAJ1765771.1 hypothetical protein LPJ74_006217 [Coemansia sp. RSA 1843]KAJ2087462.1 hypothetical protein IW138_004922 [Coemansia sp. RSA 986]KAJ2211721.1 hypothetical protein EV179_005278 [Coemansia sp. RSA 487]KAJ2566641.1 hypothetical protein IW140_004829 [Coemansia sp. RSA 1813]
MTSTVNGTALSSSNDLGASKVVFHGKPALGKNHQQSILSVLRIACADAMKQPDFSEKLQAIKRRFYDRDFDGIFLDPANLPVYTAQYVPRRALCYYEVFSTPELQSLLRERPQIYCLGAGSGSELVGISAASCIALDDSGEDTTQKPIILHSQDYTDWKPILDSLSSAIRYKWKLNDQHIEYKFSIGNLLDMPTEIKQHISSASLVTAMFVFNELFADKANAMEFVKTMVKFLRPGAFFLLVDSAGSFSSVKVGKKNYMSYMFFDSLGQFFEPVLSDNSRWFRHVPGLEYPLSIENMRYFIRLYRRK